MSSSYSFITVYLDGGPNRLNTTCDKKEAGSVRHFIINYCIYLVQKKFTGNLCYHIPRESHKPQRGLTAVLIDHLPLPLPRVVITHNENAKVVKPIIHHQ